MSIGIVYGAGIGIVVGTVLFAVTGEAWLPGMGAPMGAAFGLAFRAAAGRRGLD
ncbi:MAG: hypothetical protein OXC99_08010 [Chloroflexi bacterium]|nr:hypothetical protein [Chloroflexota bacterium]